MITSVGSLVGQNILDALEGRRAGVRVIGIKVWQRRRRIFVAISVSWRQCPSRGGYHAWLLEIMERELPDLVLAERDDDVIALAAIREQHPRFAPGIACGSLGFDQLGLVAHHFAGAERLAPSPTLGGIGVTVYKSLGDFPVRHEDAAMLKERGVWRRFS